MKRKEILIVEGNKTTALAILKLINDTSLQTTVAETTEEAIEKFHRQNFDVVIFSNELSIEDERKLRKIFTVHNADLIIINYNNEDSGSLNDKITEAIKQQDKNKKPSISLVDDALVNAGLNIIVQ